MSHAPTKTLSPTALMSLRKTPQTPAQVSPQHRRGQQKKSILAKLKDTLVKLKAVKGTVPPGEAGKKHRRLKKSDTQDDKDRVKDDTIEEVSCFPHCPLSSL